MKNKMRLVHLIIIICFLGCSKFKNKKENEIKKTEINVAYTEEEYLKFTHTIGDSIRFKAPQDWSRIDTSEIFILKKRNCEKTFCENLVVTTTSNMAGHTKMEIAEQFYFEYYSHFNNFNLLRSEIHNSDSTEMSFDYTLSGEGENLGGTTYVFIRGEKAVIFSFMGYNGDTGDYFEVRPTVISIINSISFY